VLRLWQDGDGGPWRATLKNVHTGERRHFAEVERLIAFLQPYTAAAAGEVRSRRLDDSAGAKNEPSQIAEDK
jgi:hypothetical protein